MIIIGFTSIFCLKQYFRLLQWVKWKNITYIVYPHQCLAHMGVECCFALLWCTILAAEYDSHNYSNEADRGCQYKYKGKPTAVSGIVQAAYKYGK